MAENQTFILKFFRMESAGGICLMLAAAAALIAANSPLKPLYDHILKLPVEVRVGSLEIAKPLLLWINDGLMAVFFFLVGLELKREIVEGELSDKRNIILPAVGAVGGMAIPALIYVLFNLGDTQALRGWAIPSATDIAFALGILSLLGPRVPLSVKIFLTSVAIFDDMGAIAIILVLPLFAFANAGISFIGLEAEQFLHSVPMGIMLGLLLGKQFEIFGLCWLALRFRLARLPEGMSLRTLHGVSALCGVGFTMSFFISTLAFGHMGTSRIFDERLGIILGSGLSAILGYLLLKRDLLFGKEM